MKSAVMMQNINGTYPFDLDVMLRWMGNVGPPRNFTRYTLSCLETDNMTPTRFTCLSSAYRVDALCNSALTTPEICHPRRSS